MGQVERLLGMPESPLERRNEVKDESATPMATIARLSLRELDVMFLGFISLELLADGRRLYRHALASPSSDDRLIRPP